MSHKATLIKYVISTTFLLFGMLSTLALNGKYPIQYFSPADYKAGNQNIDFAQNRDMGLFVANNLGVMSFNGYEWKKHAFRSGKKKRSLAFDQNSNRLYVGSQGEFGFFDEDWVYHSLNDIVPEESKGFDEVWDVFLIGSKVYFCTFQGIFTYDGKSISVIALEEGLNRSFLVDGKLFTQTNRGNLLELNDNELISSFKQDQIDQIISGVIPQDEGYLIFYNSGLIESANPFGVTDKHQELMTALIGTYVNHVLQLSDTRLAISTQTAGLFLYDLRNGEIENLTAQDGLQTNACLRTFQDYAGNLWVGMQNGIGLVNINSPLRFISREINIQGSGYEAFQTDEGTYYTTSNGIYFLNKNSEQSAFLNGTEGPSYGMQNIAGKLYASHHTGLFLLERGKAFKLVETNGLWQIKQLKSNPEFAVGGTYSGLFLFKLNKNKVLQGVQKISGFDQSSRFFEEDKSGNLLVGQYYKGLFKLQFGADYTQVTAHEFTTEPGIPIDEQIILTRIGNELYVATNNGLYKIDQENDQIEEGGFFSTVIGKQPIYLIVEDKQKNIHVVAENLVGFFKKISTDNYVFVPSSLFQLRYYFNNDLLNVSININKGVLFSSNEGFIHYDADLENGLEIAESIVISKVSNVTQDRTLYERKPFAVATDNNGNLVVPPGANVMQLDVESFQFNQGKNKQFRYFLKGFDEGFGEWTNATTKEYTNLREGRYEFAVQTRNYLGEITNGKPFFLLIKPPFYRSLFAKILYVGLGILSLFMVSKVQKSRYKRKVIEAEKEKQQELAMKERAIVDIERKQEEELQQLEEDKMKIELMHLNNLLAASTMNLVVKNEFIETIKEKLKEVNRKGKNRETKEALEQIVKRIDITLKLQEDWDQFEFHFDKVHGDFLFRLRNKFRDLSPNEQKLCALLRLNLNTKEIANLMNISLRGVEVARYRLRKKLDLQKGQNLSKFMLEY